MMTWRLGGVVPDFMRTSAAGDIRSESVAMPPDMNLLDVAGVGRTLANWDRERPRNIALPERRVQLYMGAMEIPMLALRSRAFVLPDDDQLTSWWPQLQWFTSSSTASP